MLCCLGRLLSGGRSDLKQGTLEQLWLQEGPNLHNSRQVPLNVDVLLKETLFKREQCFPGMGKSD